MKIAIIADPELPVPPLLYGGIERIIAMLVEGYVEAGHEVSLFAHADSGTSARLFAYQGKTSNGLFDVAKNLYLINKELFSSKYDVVHSFGRLIYLLPQLGRKLPKIMSYQREPSVRQIAKAYYLSKKNTLRFTGCSAYISKQILSHAPATPIFNGVELKVYNFNEKVDNDAPLVFLGRIEPIKGAHTAIKVAQATYKKLVIAGPVSPGAAKYFEQKITPFLSEKITYIGTINDIQKSNLLGNAAALLMPIEWDEPFGIVMAEAMACGTPVLAFNRGSVPEIVINEVNGFACNTLPEMIELVKKVASLDRKLVRQDCEARFSSSVIGHQYLNLYSQMIASNK